MLAGKLKDYSRKDDGRCNRYEFAWHESGSGRALIAQGKEQQVIVRHRRGGQRLNRFNAAENRFGLHPKVVWRARATARIDSDINELEAQFSRPEQCTGFSYRAK